MPNNWQQLIGWRRTPSESRSETALPAGPWAFDAVNDATGLGVRVRPAHVQPGAWYWQAVQIHHLAPQENQGRHHVFVDLVEPLMDDRSHWRMERVPSARVQLMWDGGEKVLSIEGAPGEPGTSLGLWRGQVCSVRALGLPGHELPSDSIEGLHTNHVSDGPGNDRGRHSFSVVFRRVQAPLSGGARRPTQPLSHYVLFGAPDDPATAAYLQMAQDYLLALRPAFGFSPDEAARAASVTIIAPESAIGREVEARLSAAEIQVERIAGSAAAVTAALNERIAQGGTGSR